jgi:protein-S-isoprenylcysteine O-methyltransferase Ste14
MWSLVAGLAIFALLALLVLGMLSSEERAEVLTGPAAIAVWFVYLVHADTVVNAAYLDVGRVDAVPASVATVAGACVIAAGFALFVWATRSLVRHGDFEGIRARRLVVAGPYRFMRQPQNAGWALMLLGIAIAGRSLIALALVAVFAIFAALLGRAEGRALAGAFAGEYRAWRDATPAVPLMRA